MNFQSQFVSPKRIGKLKNVFPNFHKYIVGNITKEIGLVILIFNYNRISRQRWIDTNSRRK